MVGEPESAPSKRLAASDTIQLMLFMVIERFKQGDAKLVGERFRRSGRMLPDSVTYQVSWMDAAGTCCFQIMEAPRRDQLDSWISRWNDLIDFEIVPVVTSVEFWSKTQSESSL